MGRKLYRDEIESALNRNAGFCHKRKCSCINCQFRIALKLTLAVLDAELKIREHRNKPEYSEATPSLGEYSRGWFEKDEELSRILDAAVKACIDAGLSK